MPSDYAYIENYSRNGNMGIHRKVFETIAYNATNRVQGASVVDKKKGKRENNITKLFDLYRPIQVVIHNDGRVDIRIPVALKVGVNVHEVCLNIQKEVATSLEEMVEQVKVNVIVNVNKIG